MIKKTLVRIQQMLSSLEIATKGRSKNHIALVKEIRSLIDSDIEHLNKRDPTFLEGSNGYVDYYSPHAEEQLRNKGLILEQYKNHLITLQALILCIQNKKNQVRLLNENKENQIDSEQNKIKSESELLSKGIEDLAQCNADHLKSNDDVQKVIQRLNHINFVKDELNKVELDLIKIGTNKPREKKELEKNKIKHITALNNHELFINKEFIKNGINREAYNDVLNHTIKIQAMLSNHLKLMEKIPRGLLDVKRALNVVQELKSIQDKINKLDNLPKDELNKEERSSSTFSSDPQIDSKIKEMLEDLRCIMNDSIKGYKALVIAGGDMELFLHRTTAFYWETLFLYHNALETIDDYTQKCRDLTPNGILVKDCMINAFQQMPQKSGIIKALSAIRKVDKNLDSRKGEYNNKVKISGHKDQEIKFYKGKAIKILERVLNNTHPLFFVPYNAHSYVLDHPAGTDLAGLLGNCYGETHMFLQRINQKNPTFNNICPQTDLVNFQLDQTRKAGPLSKPRKDFKAQKYQLVRLTIEPDTLTPELKEKLRGRCSYALFNNQVYFINSQLDIERDILKTPSSSVNSDLNHIFPVELDSPQEASINQLQKLESFLNESPKNMMVKWATIKNLLTEEADSKTNGDVCWLHFSGAKVPNHMGEVTHVFGFIKLNEAKPYKYVVYDYNVGAMGFSNEEQLKEYFISVLEEGEAYYPFSQFFVEKIADVSDECKHFISSIKPMEQPSSHKAPLKRTFWAKENLLLLIKYNGLNENDDIERIFYNIHSIEKQEVKEKIILALIGKINNKCIPHLAQLFIELARSNNYTTLLNVLNKPGSEYLKNSIIKEMKRMIKDNQFPPDLACKIVPDNVEIIEISYSKMPDSIQYANPTVISNFIITGRIKAEIAVKLFPENKEIILAVHQVNKNALKYANQEIVMQLLAPTCPANNQSANNESNVHPAEPVNSPIESHKETNELTEIKKECIDLLYSIKKNGWGDNDIYTEHFYNQKINTIERLNNRAEFDALKAELDTINIAITSPEIIAVKNQVARLQAKKNHFFGTNHLQEKIDAIKEAVYQVPLEERINVFSNQKNDPCQKVQAALNIHRYHLWSYLKSPESYAELHKKFPNKPGDDTNKP